MKKILLFGLAPIAISTVALSAISCGESKSIEEYAQEYNKIQQKIIAEQIAQIDKDIEQFIKIHSNSENIMTAQYEDIIKKSTQLISDKYQDQLLEIMSQFHKNYINDRNAALKFSQLTNIDDRLNKHVIEVLKKITNKK